MAEVTGLRNNAVPYPIYGAPFGVTFPLLDADGDPISPSSPDSEISKNGDTFADCTNEATEIATSSGSCYLLLTGTELTTDVATIQVKSSGAKTTVLTLYPRKLVTVRSGTAASGGVATNTIVLDSGASDQDDFYNGMIVIATIDSNVEVRTISDYTGSSKTATVVPDWNVAPDSDDTFVIKLPEGWQIHQSNVTHVAGTAQTAGDIIGDTNDIQTRLPAALVSGRIDSSVGAMAANVLTANALAADAVDEILDEVVEGTITLRQAIRLLLATAVGKASGLDTATAVYRDTADTVDRVTATTTADGNRTAVTLDVT